MIEPNYIYKAYISDIIDGDTVDADVDLGFSLTAKLRLRLNKVNTYELRSKDENEKKLALAAKEYTLRELKGKSVVIKTTKTDAFGRYLVDIFYEKDNSQIFFNDTLLDLKLAVIYKK